MRKKLLFLSKLLLFSIAVFVLWQNIFLRLYCTSAKHSVDLLYRFLLDVPHGPKVLESTSYYLIPFLSLVLAKSGMSYLRKAKAVAVGLAAFFAFDFALALLGFSTLIVEPPKTEMASTLAPILQVLYVTIELALPLLLWFALVNRDYRNPLGFETPVQAPKVSRRCPICRKEKAGLIDHIRSAHGEKSLRSWKVRRFLAKESWSRN